MSLFPRFNRHLPASLPAHPVIDKLRESSQAVQRSAQAAARQAGSRVAELTERIRPESVEKPKPEAPSATPAGALNFDVAFERLIGHEGLFTRDPNDPGNWTGGKIGTGELKGTKFGIAANTYPSLNIEALTLEQAKAIYKRDWWDRIQGGGMHPAVVFQLWDFAINAGMTRAVRELQAIVGARQDGRLGPQTRASVNAQPVECIILALASRRLNFYTSLSGWEHFGKGWTRRVAENLALACGDLQQAPQSSASSTLQTMAN